MRDKSDNVMKVPEDFSEGQVKEMLERMGFEQLEPDRDPLWVRIKCRVFGPHEWVPIYKMEPNTGAMVEVGTACDICHKEYWD